MAENYDPLDPPAEELPAFQWPHQSNYAREMRKWNKPYSFSRYPAMLYKAPEVRNDNWTSEARHQRVVNSEAEYERARKEGWRDDPTEALAYREELAKFVSDAAAHRHYEDLKLSEIARSEAKKADESTFEHLPEIPEKPRGRRKSAA